MFSARNSLMPFSATATATIGALGLTIRLRRARSLGHLDPDAEADEFCDFEEDEDTWADELNFCSDLTLSDALAATSAPRPLGGPPAAPKPAARWPACCRRRCTRTLIPRTPPHLIRRQCQLTNAMLGLV